MANKARYYGLSTKEERQDIIKNAIEEKKTTVDEIINLLEMEIRLHEKNERYEKAVEKWKEDAEFVKGYGVNSGNNRRIKVIKK